MENKVENMEALKMIEIVDKFQSGEIEYKDARVKLCELFGLEYKTRYSGRAVVKNDSVLSGVGIPELPIIGLYMTYKNGNGHGIFPDGSREFKLSLKGTKWEKDVYTVIHEKDLNILELKID